MKLRHLLLPSLLICTFHAQAQHILDYGQTIYKSPIEQTPYVYYDLLRNQEDYFVSVARPNLNTSNWAFEAKYISIRKDSIFAKLENYEWNANTWKPVNSYDYSFNINSGKLNSVAIKSSINNGQYQGTIKDSFVYNSSNSIISILKRRLVPTSQDISTRLFTYNVLGQVIKDSLFYFPNLNSCTYFSYQPNSIDAVTIESGDTIIKNHVIKDANGRLIYRLTKNYNGGNISSINKETFLYDQSGRVTSFESYNVNGPDTTTFQPVEKITHTYKSDGKLLGWVRYIGDTINQTWITDYKMEMKYDSNNEADTGFSYLYLNGAYQTEPISMFLFKPEATGILIGIDRPEIKIYPNPAASLLHIDNLKSNSAVMIYDNSGHIVLKDTGVSSSINISHLSPGIYTIHIDKIKTATFLKQ